MTKQFNRKVTLKLIKRDTNTEIKIEGFRTTFNVSRQDKKDANKAVITVYNLSRAMWNELSAVESSLIVSLEAGYEENIAEIFRGDITKMYAETRGVDALYTIEALDGVWAMRNIMISKSYGEKVTLGQVYDDLDKQLSELAGINVNPKPDVLDTTVKQTGLLFLANPMEILDEVARDVDLIWFMDNNVLTMCHPFDDTNMAKAVVISSETGLIGSPSFYESGAKNRQNAKKTAKKYEKGIKFKCLLNPNLQIYRRVKVESRYFDGTYKIKELQFVGDNWSSDWYAEVLAV